MKFLVALLILGLTSAWAVRIIPKEITVELYDADIKHNGWCYAKQWGIGEMKKGEIRNVFEGHCRQATCSSDRTVHYEECPKDTVSGRCRERTVEEKAKPFPDCCPNINC